MDVVGGIVVWINLGPEKLDVTEPSKGSTQKKKKTLDRIIDYLTCPFAFRLCQLLLVLLVDTCNRPVQIKWKSSSDFGNPNIIGPHM